MKSVYVGIDLGTVNTCVAVWNEKQGKAEIFETDDGKTIPSFVCFNPKSHRILVGTTGMKDLKNYESGIYDAKRFIGRKFSDPIVQQIYNNYPFKVEGTSEDNIQFNFLHKKKPVSKSPEEVSTEILKYIKECVDTHYAEKIEIKAVVTNPAYFNNDQRLATKKAAEKSGFTVMGLMKEPTAAALSFFNRNKNAQGLTVVFDLGGGTFDVSVVEKKESKIEVKCSDGDNFLGGRNFEEKIINDKVKGFENKKVSLDDYQKRRLREPIQLLKEKLSVKDEANQSVVEFQNDEDLMLNLTRTKFEQLNSRLFQQCIDVIDRCLKTNKIRKSDVKNVVMVGGSSKIPKIQNMVRDYFGSNVLVHLDDPDLSVALGAAAHAFSLSNSSEYSMVLPPLLTINESCTMSIGQNVFFGLLYLVIERNTPLPIKKFISITTIFNNQETVRNTWYEGNFKNSSKNHYLGEILHTDLPKRRAGEIDIETTIEVDVDNILKITSKVPEINQTKTLTLSLHEKLKDVKIGLPEWTQRDDEHFERMALIKNIFHSYYTQFAYIREIDQNTQNTMTNELQNLNGEGLILKEIHSFVNKYDDGKSECIKFIKELLKNTESDIEVLRYMDNSRKRNLES